MIRVLEAQDIEAVHRQVQLGEAPAPQFSAGGPDVHTAAPLQVVDLLELERMSYRQGWRWGAFCGGCVALLLATIGAVLIGIIS